MLRRGAVHGSRTWETTKCSARSFASVGTVAPEAVALRYPPPHSEEAVRGQSPTGYQPPLGGTEALPFRVLRSKSGQLPVYTDYRNGRTKKVTILRKFIGDRKELREEVWRVLGGPENPSLEITERVGSLEIKGDYSWPIKMWLKRLGF